MKRRLLWIAIGLFAGISAHAGQTMTDAFTVGKDLGKVKNQSASSGISTQSAKDNVPAYGQSAPESNYFQGGNGNTNAQGVAKLQSCQTAGASGSPIERQECDAVNFLAKNPNVRPQFNISKNDSMVKNTRGTQNSAESILGSLGQGSNTLCTVKTETVPAQYETNSCVTIKQVDPEQCTMGRIIKTDTDTNFQCNQTVSAYDTLKCRRGSNVTCSGGGDGCDAGGIIPGSWAGDMAVSWTPDGAGNYILQFGTIAEDYWQGWGTIFDRTLTFEVRDPSLITLATLSRTRFDDWMLVQVNGSTVYVGPFGGDRLEITGPPTTAMSSETMCSQNERSSSYTCATWTGGYRGYYVYQTFGYCQFRYTNNGNSGTWYCGDVAPGMVQYCATCYRGPELSTPWNFYPNIDIKPYLKQGTNSIFVRVIVAGGGEGAIQITTRQKCPVNCSVTTNNQCSALEARAQ